MPQTQQRTLNESFSQLDAMADRARVAARREEEIQKAKAKQAKTISTGEHIRDERLREINETYARRMVEIWGQRVGIGVASGSATDVRGARS